jgi:hypothetical protein
MFDESTVVSINPAKYQGNQAWVSWVASMSGLLWQAYADGSKVYEGHAQGFWIAAPTDTVSRVQIGSILESEAGQDFSASLPSAPKRRATITWTGGTALASDIQGFHVYMSPTAGAAVDYSRAISTIAAFPGGSPVASGSFSYTSGVLTSGAWTFGVRPYDAAGNEGTAQETTVTISVPPGPPSGSLTYVFHPAGTTPTVTLQWGASPG